MTGFIFLRVRAHRLLLVAALLAVLLTTSVLATLTGFSGAIGDAALRHSLLTRSAAPASLVVRTDVTPGERAEVERKVEAGARRVFDGLPVSLRAYEKSSPYALPRSFQAPQDRAGDPYLTHLADLDRSRIRLVEGVWPKATDKGAIQVALPQAAAKELDLTPGGPPVKLSDRLDGPPVTVQVTGVYQPKDATDPYWQVDELNGRGARKLDFTTYGPLLTDPATFAESRVAPGDSAWLATADFRDVRVDRIAELKEAAEKGSKQFAKLSGITAGLTAETELPTVLERAERSLLVARSTLLIVALQLILLAGYALLLVARLLSSERAGETDLLVARGGSRGRVAWFSAAESLLLAVPAALLAPLLAGPLTQLLAGQGALERIGLELETAPTFAVWLVALVVALGCATAVVAPALSFTGMRRSVRMKSLPAPVRAGADVGLLAIAAVAYWQLDRQTSGGGVLSGDTEGELGVDPLLVGAPALALLAGTILTLRLLPPAAKLGERRAAKGRGLPGALAGWQLSRRPLRGAGPVLLLVLAVAMGMLAIGQGASWDRSQEDQADFNVGTHLRVQGGRVPTESQGEVYSSLPGVRDAAPAVRRTMELSGERTADLLALDLRHAADDLLLREDLGSGKELRDVLLERKAPSYGVALPAAARKAEFEVRIGSDKPTGTGDISVSAEAQDRYGTTRTLPLGKVTADGRTRIIGAELPATGPFTLTGFTLEVPPSRGRIEQHTFQVTSIRSDGKPIAPPGSLEWVGFAQDGATESPELPELTMLETGSTSDAPLSAAYSPPLASPDGPSVREVRITVARTSPPVPAAVVTERFLKASGAKLGATLDLPLSSSPLPIKIAKVVPELPTSTANGGAVLLDLRAVQAMKASKAETELTPSEWWLTSEPGKAEQAAGALRARPDVDPEQVLVRAEMAQELRDDPLGAGPQSALLAVALVAAALAAVGFAVSAAGSLRERAAEFSVLRALGTPQRQLARLIAAEQGVLIGLALAVGLALGAVLTRAVVPLIVLTGDAGKPVPSVLVELPLGRVALLLAAVAAVPLLVVAAIALRRADPVVSLRHEGGN
ncbi:ABC transporter permease [Streptomyces sp. YC504]|uniref:ABC transporter permease n=1 Tax=Streptomyces mesophilus TaxID=1775132 RepID=A0A6G4XUS9_9ACTN|nr:ABC transporter permease [Streptomyces mesophilus]NGO80361.1 ABC transporter permease [Streptomyces mesophilus]